MKQLSIKLFALLMAAILASPSLPAQRRENRGGTESQDPLSGISMNGFRWRSIGPALTSGRISDIAVNPQNHSEFYVAPASGNVWKTTNAGLNFEPIFDNEGSYSIGCVRSTRPIRVWYGLVPAKITTSAA
jgi:hypothetical protein